MSKPRALTAAGAGSWDRFLVFGTDTFVKVHGQLPPHGSSKVQLTTVALKKLWRYGLKQAKKLAVKPSDNILITNELINSVSNRPKKMELGTKLVEFVWSGEDVSGQPASINWLGNKFPLHEFAMRSECVRCLIHGYVHDPNDLKLIRSVQFFLLARVSDLEASLSPWHVHSEPNRQDAANCLRPCRPLTLRDAEPRKNPAAIINRIGHVAPPVSMQGIVSRGYS